MAYNRSGPSRSYGRSSSGGSYRGNSSRSSGYSGGNSFGGRSSDNRERPEMFKVQCANCGKDAMVPFKPNGRKPVFCSDCFEKESGTEQRGRRDDRSFNENRNFNSDRSSERPNFEDRQMFSAVCDDCGASCEVPFKPSSEKPIFCDNCFAKKRNGEGVNRRLNERYQDRSNSDKISTVQSSVDLSDLKLKMDLIAIKLDKILHALIPADQIIEEPVVITETLVETAIEKPIKKAKKSSIKKEKGKSKKVKENDIEIEASKI